MQQGLVMAIRSLMADATEDQVSGEIFRAQIADLYPSTALLSPGMMKQPLIHQTLLAWLRTHDVHLGGTEDMRSVRRLAATLYPAGGDKLAAQQILNNIDLRNESLCRYEHTLAVPGWTSGQEGLVPTPPSGARSVAAVHASATNNDRDDLLPPNLGSQDVRSGLPPLTAFGRPASQIDSGRRQQMDLGESRSGVRTNAADLTDTTLAHRISLRFKNDSSKFSGDANECLDDFVADYELICKDYGL